MTSNGKISRSQEAAVAALISSPSVPVAAKAAGMSERSLYRWLTKERFKEAYRTARRELVHHALGLIQGAMSEAVVTLQNVMKNDDCPASARVSAARALLDLGLKATEHEDVENRLCELERRIGERE